MTYQQTFDAENRLAAVTAGGQTTAFTYDGDGQRVKKVDAGGTTYYVGGYYEVKSGVVTKYYYLGGQRVAMRANGVLYYLHGDHLGSTSLTTTQGGGLYAEQRYYPYGELRWSSGTLPTDYTFTGQREESGIKLYDYRARFYSPYLGRFISPDTLVPDPTNSMEFSRYGYCLGNPVNFIDPTGHQVYFGDDDEELISRNFAGGGSGSVTASGSGHLSSYPTGPGYFDRVPLDPTRIGGPQYVPTLAEELSVSNSELKWYYGAEGIANTAQSLYDMGLSADDIVFQFQKNRPSVNKAPTFSDVPREGEEAISCQYGPACGNDPKQALDNAFHRLPRVGEHYRSTTIEALQNTGRIVEYDAGKIINGVKMPAGHISIYGTNDPAGFNSVWSEPILFSGPYMTE